jgi:hypothetical protein
MKYVTIIIIISIFLLSGCTEYVEVPVVETVVVTETITETLVETEYIEDTERIDKLEEEVLKYQELIGSLNELLECVYYGYAENDSYESDGFTVFSLEYNNEVYFITAGHAVHYNFDGVDSGVYTSFKFKNEYNDWIYPRLLTYENNFIANRDYAILYSDRINNGFNWDIENSYPNYIIGNGQKNTIKDFIASAIVDGESGAPVVDIDGEVIGIATGQFVDIDIVLEAIDMQ